MQAANLTFLEQPSVALSPCADAAPARVSMGPESLKKRAASETIELSNKTNALQKLSMPPLKLKSKTL